ncbi:MAG: glutamine--tRNA ligase/YqeY domain fusion protein [Phycisphaerales bacterium JB039]
MSEIETAPKHFIRQKVEEDVASGKWGPPGDSSVVRTRFPPEPNGYLHIGHCKSMWINFGLAEQYGGKCNLRFDDTNPEKEEQEYVDSIVRDVRWLGFRWTGRKEAPGSTGGTPVPPDHEGVLFASDYFGRMHDWAVELIRKGLAYVDEQSAEEIRKSRGTLTEPGTPSPFRDRPVAESLDLFERMRRGEFADGSKVLRAKIDMASGNINLRDPVMYRIVNARHHRTGDAWHIYPMYDWAHGLEDSIEGITHSICTLEFEDHRPLYDWFIEAINRGRTGDGAGEWGKRIHHPQQIEFARLGLNYTVMSKRKLLTLVKDRHVRGWDDPRMPTVSGLRRGGYTPEAIKSFCADTGVTKFNAVIDVGRLENALRDDLNRRAPRRMVVLRPLKVIIENWAGGPDGGGVDWLDAVNNPEDGSAGTRKVPFSGEIYIEADDFMEDPPRKFFRLAPGAEVRLRYGYWITCTGVEKDAAGNVIALRATYDPQTRGGDNPPPDAEGNVRKVKGTLHWVSAAHAVDVEARLFDRLFSVENPDRKPKEAGADWDFTQNLNPNSLEIVRAKAEPALLETAGEPEWGDGIRRFQFERQGYFCVDPDSAGEKLVVNRTVTLKDSWAKAKG